jgi:CheY-like chemotaxis protein/prolyl-tRNA editing enzyme YbaK/EbsC (Cys-tRNA(Pro) deacylase)
VAVPLWFQRILQHCRLDYQLHQPVAQVKPAGSQRVARTILLASGRHPVTVVLPAGCRLDLASVQTVLGGPPLRAATDAESKRWFQGCPPGAVPPLRLRSNQRVIMDRSLAHFGTLLFPAGSLDQAVEVGFRDWYRAVRPGIGRFAMPTTNGKATPPKVMVVEDEADTNELFCRFLEMEGFTCVGVHDGGRAVTMASEMHPAAILLDLMLPDISGYDAYERLCACGPMKRIPFIVVSALDDEASRQRGRQLGADAYLTKPFHPDELAAELRGVLADARA